MLIIRPRRVLEFIGGEIEIKETITEEYRIIKRIQKLKNNKEIEQYTPQVKIISFIPRWLPFLKEKQEIEWENIRDFSASCEKPDIYEEFDSTWYKNKSDAEQLLKNYIKFNENKVIETKYTGVIK